MAAVETLTLRPFVAGVGGLRFADNGTFDGMAALTCPLSLHHGPMSMTVIPHRSFRVDGASICLGGDQRRCNQRRGDQCGQNLLHVPIRCRCAFVRSEEHTSELQSLMRTS